MYVQRTYRRWTYLRRATLGCPHRDSARPATPLVILLDQSEPAAVGWSSQAPQPSSAPRSSQLWDERSAGELWNLVITLDRQRAELRALAADLGDTARSAIERHHAELQSTLESVYGMLVRAATIPASDLFAPFVTSAVALAAQQGKHLRIHQEGAETRAATHVLHALREPLGHLVRNAIDHGIERTAERGTKRPSGMLVLRAAADPH